MQQIFCTSFPNLLLGSYFSASSSVGEETRRTLSRHSACAHTPGGLGADSVLPKWVSSFHRAVIAFSVSVHGAPLLNLMSFEEKLHQYPMKNYKTFKYVNIALPNILLEITPLEPF